MADDVKKMDEETKLQKEEVGEEKKTSLLARIFATLCLLIFAVMIGIFIYFIITGSEYIMAMLFVVIIFPVILYLIVWLRKVFSR
ncbi:MAG: hypothetical protein J6I58_03340 [Eubacterium sp.]|nr:hypothetical protein [Eubacterium sp.]